eukprot:TRINITY_DN13339_c0_g1_i1.p1 TRINITY_DN13339_c0_g1~~TRINITY_DN13339_c0_g1_i1.p1  ORF type:complete len:469 (+),score=109.27 TRINITY_DN13339_c0_g1_i1:64-1470(+)
MLLRGITRRCIQAAAQPAPEIATTTYWDLEKEILERAMIPRAVVTELDKYIIGQDAAKRAVAISLRNRWRRTMLKDKDLRDDIHPKNILMVGPTGVGKTEISRRMAKLTDAPFVKVEATKYTEVGFKGRDVDSIVEDLFTASVQRAKKLAQARQQDNAKQAAIQIILSKIVPDNNPEELEKYKALLLEGALDEKEIDFSVAAEEPNKKVKMDDERMQGLIIFSDHKGKDEKGKTKKLTAKIKEAMQLIINDELEKLIDSKQIQLDAVKLAENHGVVFIDEIDKVVAPKKNRSADTSGEGVQQDLLPLIEGCVVTLKDGTTIKTDNVLFICSGAFHIAKPSEMIAELQGRLPVRVELSDLTENDFYRILTEPAFNQIKQNQELLKTEGVGLNFTEDAIRRVAAVTKSINGEMQNIGARRLVTVIEKIVEDISFEAETYKGKTVTIDASYVDSKIADLRKRINDPTKTIL